MKSDNENQGEESISVLKHDEEPEQAKSSSQKIKVETKIQSKHQISCLHIHKNTLYLGTNDAKLYVYKITQNQTSKVLAEGQDFLLKREQVIKPNIETISMVKADDKYFVLVSETDNDCFVSIWSVDNRHFVTALKGHESQVSQIVFMKYRNNIATSSWDCTIRIWQLDDFQKQGPVKTFHGNYPILDLKQFNQEILISGGDDCYLLFWNWKKNEIVKKQFGHAGSVTFIQVIDNNIFTAGGDNKFKFWQVSKAEITQNYTQQDPINFKSQYQIKKLDDCKEEYASIVYGAFYDRFLVLMDKQGELFLFKNFKKYYRLPNLLGYNETITGIDVFGEFVLITTSKGCLKQINLRHQIEKLNINLDQQSVMHSQTNMIKVSFSNSIQQSDIQPSNHQPQNNNYPGPN